MLPVPGNQTKPRMERNVYWEFLLQSSEMVIQNYAAPTSVRAPKENSNEHE